MTVVLGVACLGGVLGWRSNLVRLHDSCYGRRVVCATSRKRGFNRSAVWDVTTRDGMDVSYTLIGRIDEETQ